MYLPFTDRCCTNTLNKKTNIIYTKIAQQSNSSLFLQSLLEVFVVNEIEDRLFVFTGIRPQVCNVGRLGPTFRPEISSDLRPRRQDFVLEVLVGQVGVALRVDEEFGPVSGCRVSVEVSGPSVVHHAQLDRKSLEVPPDARKDPQLGKSEIWDNFVFNILFYSYLCKYLDLSDKLQLRDYYEY